METYYQPSKLQDEQVRTTGWMEHHIPYSILIPMKTMGTTY